MNCTAGDGIPVQHNDVAHSGDEAAASHPSSGLSSSSSSNPQSISQGTAAKLAKLRQFDRAVMDRWNMIAEAYQEGGSEALQRLASLDSCSNVELVQRAAVDYGLELAFTLDQAAVAAFNGAPVCTEGVLRYQRIAVEEALRAAREGVLGMGPTAAAAAAAQARVVRPPPPEQRRGVPTGGIYFPLRQ